MLNVVLYQPEIPPNTGNIARHCVGMQARLHLVGPMRIDIDDRTVRRAGLDYWKHLKLKTHATPEDFLQWMGDDRQPWLITLHGETRFDKATYEKDAILIFGSETRGLPEAWHKRWPDRRLNIPILGNIRSYNLANTVAVVLTQAALKTNAL